MSVWIIDAIYLTIINNLLVRFYKIYLYDYMDKYFFIELYKINKQEFVYFCGLKRQWILK